MKQLFLFTVAAYTLGFLTGMTLFMPPTSKLPIPVPGTNPKWTL